MRETQADGWIVRNSSKAPRHALRLAVTALSIGFVMTAGAARAGDDDDRSFQEKIVDGFYSVIRSTNMDSRGIDYRERSPLVVPPKLDLPPPAASTEDVKVANWPKDPDEKKRKAIIAAKKKAATPVDASRLTPNTANAIAAAPAGAVPGAAPAAADAAPPPAPERVGTAKTDPVYDQGGDLFKNGLGSLSPSSLGITDALGLDGLFGKKAEAVPFKDEPSREALTQPPAGYQTPSPNYAYGVGPTGFLDRSSNPDYNPLQQRSSASSQQ